MLRFVRLRHDDPPRSSLPKWKGLPNPPETVTFSNTPGHRKGVVPISAAWLEFIRGINEERSYKFLLHPGSGWVNKSFKEGKEPAPAEALSFGGNVVVIDEISGNYGKIRAFDYQETPPYQPDDMNYNLYPQYVNKFTVITPKGVIQNPGSGLDVYFPLIQRTELWVDLDCVEFFPEVPTTVTVQLWARPWLNVRQYADVTSKIVGKLRPNKSVAIHEYVPRGSSVWGHTDEGWIALLWYPVPGYFKEFTNWHMKTSPPIPPELRG